MSPAASGDHPDWQSCYAEPVLSSATGWLASGEATGRLLDIGCSGGNRSAGMPRGLYRIGIDPDLAALRVAARRYPGASFLAADAASLPFRDASFDAIFSYSVMQYVDRAGVTREAGRVLREEGRAAIMENSGSYLPAVALRRLGMPHADHGRTVSHLDRRALSLYGCYFDVERIERFHLLTPLSSIPAVLASFLSRRPIGPPPRFLYNLLGGVDRLLVRAGLTFDGEWLVLLLLRKKNASSSNPRPSGSPEPSESGAR